MKRALCLACLQFTDAERCCGAPTSPGRVVETGRQWGAWGRIAARLTEGEGGEVEVGAAVVWLGPHEEAAA